MQGLGQNDYRIDFEGMLALDLAEDLPSSTDSVHPPIISVPLGTLHGEKIGRPLDLWTPVVFR